MKGFCSCIFLSLQRETKPNEIRIINYKLHGGRVWENGKPRSCLVVKNSTLLPAEETSLESPSLKKNPASKQIA